MRPRNIPSDYDHASVDALVHSIGILKEVQSKLLLQAKNCDPTWSCEAIEEAAQKVEYLQDNIVSVLSQRYPNVQVGRLVNKVV